MRKLLIIFALLLTSCSCELFAQEHTYKLIWDYNDPVEQVESYSVFIVELTDTLNSPLSEGVHADSVRAYQLANVLEADLKATSPDSAVYEFVQDQNGKYIHAGVTAVNGYGESSLAVSAFYLKDYNMLPSMVKAIKVDK